MTEFLKGTDDNSTSRGVLERKDKVTIDNKGCWNMCIRKYWNKGCSWSVSCIIANAKRVC